LIWHQIVVVTAEAREKKSAGEAIPRFGPEALSLSAPETIIWNGNGVMTWRKTPDMTWKVQTRERAAYEMRFEQLRVEADFLAGEDCVQQRFTAVTYLEDFCFDAQQAAEKATSLLGVKSWTPARADGKRDWPATGAERSQPAMDRLSGDVGSRNAGGGSRPSSSASRASSA
jgi:hypothetical protein